MKPCPPLFPGIVILLACCGSFHSAQAAVTADNITHFSEGRLKALGIDPGAAAYFARGGRFSPGTTEAELQVNGRSLGVQKLTFGPDGKLCADEAFFSSAGIHLPSPLPQKETEDGGCPALSQVWPSANVSLLPASQEVSVVVPPESIIRENDLPHFRQGGSAALLNYSAYRSHFESYGDRSDFSYLNLESGFNAGDWMVRSAHNLSQGSTGRTNIDTPYIYAQRTLVGRKQLLQAGQINFSNPLLSGAPLDGIQLVPQAALNRQGSGAQVSGIARADQSRVEVRQNSIQIYSTLVPAGPFTLTDIPLLNNTSDLQLTVTGPDGGQENFTVAAAAARRLVPQAPENWSLALGLLRTNSTEADYERPWVASLSDGWGLSNKVLLEAGAIAAPDYMNGGTGMTVSLRPELVLRMSGALSQDRNHDQKGTKGSIQANLSAPLNFSFGGNVTLYSPGYRELVDAYTTTDSLYSRTSTGLSIGWNHALVGSVSLSASQTRQGDNGADTRYLMAAWNRKIGVVNTSVNWHHQSRSVRSCSTVYRCSNSDRDSLYINLSFPLGAYQLRSYYRNTQGSAVAGLQSGGDLTENSSWSLSVERSLQEQQYSILSGNVNGNMHYTTAGLYGYVAGNDVRNYSGTLSGSIVAHKEGVMFSPYKVSDTFGVVAVKPAISGVEFNTPQGKVWTDWRGKAVVPGLPAYAPGRIELNTERLPENTDVSNGLQQVIAGHGAVTDTHFILQQTRNGLLTVKLADGTPLPKGSTITTEDGSYVTTAIDAGTVFVTDLNDKRPLRARWQEKSCRLEYTVAEKAQKGVAYENISATCS
ncbi:fimbrial biogenesis usher protein [Erwinia sp. BNK-24-b]|uniref:fimbrial biogenesis usher protein n=1 Tax=unclassified Erwinia TaxID=2622719 RepID=UPI0039BEE83E